MVMILIPRTEVSYMAMIVVDRFSQRVFVISTWKIATGPMCAEPFHDEITCRNVRGVPKLGNPFPIATCALFGRR